MKTTNESIAGLVELTGIDDGLVRVRVDDIVGICTPFDGLEPAAVKVCCDLDGEHVCFLVQDAPEVIFGRVRSAAEELIQAALAANDECSEAF